MSDETGHRPAPSDDVNVVSWRMIASGMPVIASDGTQVGRVTHVLGDPEEDIFDGVGFQHDRSASPRMASASVVERITDRAVYLSVSAAEAEQCAPYQEEHVFRVGTPGLFGRLRWRERE